MPAVLPAAFVAWHYVVQLSRPRWGYGSDLGGRRTPWIVGGMGVVALGAILATDAVLMREGQPGRRHRPGAAGLQPDRRRRGRGGHLGPWRCWPRAWRRSVALQPPAVTWIMMIVGIVVSAGVGGALLQPVLSPAPGDGGLSAWPASPSSSP